MVATCLVVAGCGGGTDSDEDGDRWRLDFVSASRDMVLLDVVAVGREEGWAVALDNTSGEGDEVPTYTLLHRDGDDWRPSPSHPGLRSAGGAELSGLAASGPDDVWVFGRFAADEIGGAPTQGALRWDGGRWRRAAADFMSRDAVAVAPDDVWALDASTPEPTAHHWDGERWSTRPVPGSYLDSLAASGPDDVWAAGSTDDRPAIAHFDGTGWQPVPVPEAVRVTDGMIYDIVSTGPDDAWAFGGITTESATSNDPSFTPFVLRWNGSEWRQVSDAVDDSAERIPTRTALLATGDGAGGFVMASVIGAEQHRTRDGDLTVIADPEPVAGRTDEITEADRRQHIEVRDLQLVPGTREIWAVGAVGVSPALPGEAYARGVVASYRLR